MRGCFYSFFHFAIPKSKKWYVSLCIGLSIAADNYIFFSDVFMGFKRRAFVCLR